MEQQALPDHGGRRSGIDRRVLFTEMPSETERRFGDDRRMGFDRRLKVRFVSRAIKNLNTIKFDKLSTMGSLIKEKNKKN
jgi:hypothetical protein